MARCSWHFNQVGLPMPNPMRGTINGARRHDPQIQALSRSRRHGDDSPHIRHRRRRVHRPHAEERRWQLSHGRTVEFGIPLEFDLAVVPRGYSFVGQTPLGDGKKWSSKYGAVGVIVFGNLGIMDGINEKGLAIGAFYFPTEAEYTKTTAANQAQSMSAVDFSNWVLTSFANVDEVRKAIEAGDAVVAPTLLPGWPQTVQPFHWVVYDKSGKALVIEPVGGKLVLHDNPLGVLTNSPTFDWHMTNLRNYIALDPLGASPVKIDGKTFQSFGMGDGMLGLPGDFTPPSRFVRSAVFSSTAKPAANVDRRRLQRLPLAQQLRHTRRRGARKIGQQLGDGSDIANGHARPAGPALLLQDL